MTCEKTTADARVVGDAYASPECENADVSLNMCILTPTKNPPGGGFQGLYHH